VAFVELHVNVAALPAATARGFAASVAVGITLTATLAGELEPPGPEQVNEYSVFTVSAAVVAEPLVALVPFHPPDAVHEDAFAETQVRTDVPPGATESALLCRVTVGMTFTVT
jgi:hypothetical protein